MKEVTFNKFVSFTIGAEIAQYQNILKVIPLKGCIYKTYQMKHVNNC